MERRPIAPKQRFVLGWLSILLGFAALVLAADAVRVFVLHGMPVRVWVTDYEVEEIHYSRHRYGTYDSPSLVARRRYHIRVVASRESQVPVYTVQSFELLPKGAQAQVYIDPLFHRAYRQLRPLDWFGWPVFLAVFAFLLLIPWTIFKAADMQSKIRWAEESRG